MTDTNFDPVKLTQSLVKCASVTPKDDGALDIVAKHLSELGFDCSGFIQTVFKSFGIRFPRDSHQQMEYNGLLEIEYSDAQVGDLLFFADNKIVIHVAICIGNEEIIHSSGYVKIEKLKENQKLYNNLYKIMSIRNLINE